VLFFGAGASKTFGYPLTGEILPRIRERLRSRELFPVASNPKRERAKMARLEDYLTQLMPAFFKHDYLPLITDVLSLIDLLLSTKEVAVPMMSDKQLEDMRTLLEQAIVEAITTGNDDVSTERLEKLSDWILGARGGSPITVVSTNYDTLIEERLFTKMTLYEHLPVWPRTRAVGHRRSLDGSVDPGAQPAHHLAERAGSDANRGRMDHRGVLTAVRGHRHPIHPLARLPRARAASAAENHRRTAGSRGRDRGPIRDPPAELHVHVRRVRAVHRRPARTVAALPHVLMLGLVPEGHWALGPDGRPRVKWGAAPSAGRRLRWRSHALDANSRPVLRSRPAGERMWQRRW
jgi:hypothetical protein